MNEGKLFSLEETLEEFNDFSFDSKSMIREAETVLEEQKESGYLLEGTFDSPQWKLLCHTRHTTSTFNFQQIEDKLRFSGKDYPTIILSLKCWVASLLPQRSVESLHKYLTHVVNFMEKSNVYSPEKLEDIETYLRLECDDRTTWNLCIPTINFLDFYSSIDSDELYRLTLLKIKEEIDIKNVSGGVRKLPPAKDVLLFSDAVERYFKIEDDPLFLKFYAIKIWWDLSNLIPMRPSEFCEIERNALLKENDRYYIRLPRLKQKNNIHRIQVIDKISIPKKLYEKIQQYIDWTEPFGSSETLISYAAIKERRSNSPFEQRFRHHNLQILLYEFYEKVVDVLYGNVYEQQLRPGDTRHFAFLNLMRQGYHPIEIARLGGHTSIQAQYHYQQHLEYWVDIEIIDMMQKMNHRQQNSSVHSPIDRAFILEKVIKRSEPSFKMELDIGYCTDPDMYCQVEKCYFCDYWKIDQEGFIRNQEQIKREMNDCKTEIDWAIKAIQNLYQVAMNEKDSTYFSEQDTVFQKDLLYNKNHLDEKLHQYFQFTARLKGDDNLEC